MATTYLSPQQLKDFAQRVDEVAKKFPTEVVRIRHSFSRDWDGDPAIYFRIVLTDEARRRLPLWELTGRVRRRADQRLSALHIGVLGIHPVLRIPNQGRTGPIKRPTMGIAEDLADAGRPSCQSSAKRTGTGIFSAVDIHGLLRSLSSSGSGGGPELEWLRTGAIRFGTKIRTQDHEGCLQCGIAEVLAWLEHSFTRGAGGIGGCRQGFR